MLTLKQRYIWTKNNRLRLRYVVSALALFVSTGSVSYKAMDIDLPSLDLHVPAISFSLPQFDNHSDTKGNNIANTAILTAEQNIVASLGFEQEASSVLIPEPVKNSDKNAPAPTIKHADDIAPSPNLTELAIATKKPLAPSTQDLRVGSGDTLSEILQDAGVSVRDSILALRAMGNEFDPRRVRQGQKLTIKTSTDADGSTALDKLTLPVSVAKHVIITRENDAFKTSVLEKDVTNKNFAKSLTIDSSLYASAARAGIPAQIIAELIRVYSWDIDFQRDIRSGDNLEILYSTKETEDGEFAGYGDIAYANLATRGKDRAIYRFETKDGRPDFYGPNGRSIRKTLMKTPVDGARLSSGFGMRKHPVLGYSKMHKGTDFAAPTGTPIYAAGDGTVEYAGRLGSYGNYIRIRHNGSLKTAYAHMHKFAKKMHKGKRVEQGEVIGYIGTTGRSTGPHLHYEVLKNNVQVSPNRLDLPVGDALKGQEYARFKALVGITKQEYATLANDKTNVADVSDKTKKDQLSIQ